MTFFHSNTIAKMQQTSEMGKACFDKFAASAENLRATAQRCNKRAKWAKLALTNFTASAENLRATAQRCNK
ncbi:MAG: hypothetical protein IKY37_02550, partial [Bacteroidaceae bacterium]|nr:hypothetical protein [Bacteroidaceae bacterium]